MCAKNKTKLQSTKKQKQGNAQTREPDTRCINYDLLSIYQDSFSFAATITKIYCFFVFAS